MASWRPLCQNKTAIRITGSPFKSFVEAEEACIAMLQYLMNVETATLVQPRLPSARAALAKPPAIPAPHAELHPQPERKAAVINS